MGWGSPGPGWAVKGLISLVKRKPEESSQKSFLKASGLRLSKDRGAFGYIPLILTLQIQPQVLYSSC